MTRSRSSSSTTRCGSCQLPAWSPGLLASSGETSLPSRSTTRRQGLRPAWPRKRRGGEASEARHGTSREPRQAIADALLPLVELPGILLAGKRLYRRVFELYLSTSLGFADCYHVALMERWGSSEIFSFDTDFDRTPSIKRRDS